MGPSWYIMDNLYEDVFNYFNYSSNNFYELYKPNFSYSIFLNNNTLHIPNNYNVLYKNIINNYDQNNTLKQYFNDASLFENISYPILWSKQDDIYDLFNVFYRFNYNTLKQIFNIKLDNYISHIESHTSNNIIKLLLKWPVIFVGNNPKYSSNIYSLLNNNIYKNGVFIPYNIIKNTNNTNIRHFDNNLPIKSLIKIANKLNIKFYLNHSVNKYYYQNNKIKKICFNYTNNNNNDTSKNNDKYI